MNVTTQGNPRRAVTWLRDVRPVRAGWPAWRVTALLTWLLIAAGVAGRLVAGRVTGAWWVLYAVPAVVVLAVILRGGTRGRRR